MSLNLPKSGRIIKSNHSPLTSFVKKVPSSLYKQRSLLNDLIASNEILPYVLQFSSSPLTTVATHSLQSCFQDEQLNSTNSNEFIEFSPESSKDMENSAPDNSLFLAISRSILFKIEFESPGYESVIREFLFNENETTTFIFNSDVDLQEVLRRKLCLHWLDKVRDGHFKNGTNCKYSK
jgi:hypothetical protein